MQEIPKSISTPQETKTEDIDYIELLHQLRDDWSDIIPKKIIHSTDEDNKYKVRRAWWTVLFLSLESAIEFGVITNSRSIKKIYLFMDRYEETLKARDPNARDIKKANELLDEVLKGKDK